MQEELREYVYTASPLSSEQSVLPVCLRAVPLSPEQVLLWAAPADQSKHFQHLDLAIPLNPQEAICSSLMDPQDTSLSQQIAKRIGKKLPMPHSDMTQRYAVARVFVYVFRWNNSMNA